MSDDSKHNWRYGSSEEWTHFTPTVTGPGFELWNGTLLAAYNRDLTEVRIRFERGSATKGTPEQLTLPNGFGADPPSELDGLLTEAALLLATEPKAGELLGPVQTRQVRAQHLLLTAQLAMLRRQR